MNLNSQILEGLKNSFSISLNSFNYTDNSNSSTVTSFQGNVYNTSTETGKITESLTNLLIKENLAYHKNWGDMNFDAILNFSFRKVNDTANYNFITTSNQYLNTFYNQSPQQVSSGSNSINYTLYFITPSFNLYYKNIVNMQGGFVDILNSYKDFIANEKVDRLFPFISTTFNVGKLLGHHFDNFSIFGSFSRKSQLLADGYGTLLDFSISNYSPITNSYQLGSSNGLTSAYYGNALSPYSSYNSFQTGVVIGLTKNLTLNYSFEYRYYKALGSADFNLPSTYGVLNIPYYFDNKVVGNRIGLNYNLKTNNLIWKVGLNASESRLQLANTGYYLNTAGTNITTTYYIPTNYYGVGNNNNNINNGFYNQASQSSPSFRYSDKYYGTDLGKDYRWSGGLTNRFSCKSFFAGMDVLYQIGERPYYIYNLNTSTTPVYNPTPLNNNSFSLQNLYIGEQIKITKLNYAEIYLNGRNILQNNSSTITDNRRYFGAGFKVAL